MGTVRKKKAKKKTKRKPPVKKSAELVIPKGTVLSIADLRKRMQTLFHADKETLNRMAEDDRTPIGDLIVLRLLKNLETFGRMSDFIFYSDIAFGKGNAVGGIGEGGVPDDPDQKSPQVIVLPSNGSEAV